MQKSLQIPVWLSEHTFAISTQIKKHSTTVAKCSLWPLHWGNHHPDF